MTAAPVILGHAIVTSQTFHQRPHQQPRSLSAGVKRCNAEYAAACCIYWGKSDNSRTRVVE
jgi:hypothetical protein